MTTPLGTWPVAMYYALLGLTVEHAFKLMALLISFLVANQVDFHTFVRCHSTAAQLAQHSIASPLYSRICTLTVRNYYCRKALHALPIHILPPQKVLSSRLIPIRALAHIRAEFLFKSHLNFYPCVISRNFLIHKFQF